MSHSGQNVDMMEGEDVDMMENAMDAVNVGMMEDGMEAGNVDVMEVEDPQPQEERRKRGPTMCTKTSERNDLHIEFRKDGSAKGKTSREYSNWCSNLVKQKASILTESWDKFSDQDKDGWWNIVKVKYLTILFLF